MLKRKNSKSTHRNHETISANKSTLYEQTNQTIDNSKIKDKHDLSNISHAKTHRKLDSTNFMAKNPESIKALITKYVNKILIYV